MSSASASLAPEAEEEAVGPGGASKRDFTVTKYVDKASPDLFKACNKGTHFAVAIIHVRKAGGKPQEFLVIKMTDVIITSYQTGSSKAGQKPTETLSLNFTKIQFKNVQQ
jgi:type VI secretion system secreted protein Hcp